MPLPNINPPRGIPSRPSPKAGGSSFKLPSHNAPAAAESFLSANRSTISVPTPKEEVLSPSRPDAPRVGLNLNKEQGVVQERKQEGSFLFGEKSAIGRRAMKYKLRVPDKKALTAERQSGLSLSRNERSELVKKYIPNRLGRTITKEEFRKTIKKSEKKTIADPGLRKQHLRETEYLKKIGGLK